MSVSYSVQKRILLQKILLSTGFILLCALSAVQGSEQKANERVLRFPADMAVGILYRRPLRANGYDIGNSYDGWVRIGEARGNIRISKTSDVRLDVNVFASRDLTVLKQLHPDDIQTIRLTSTDVNDEGLRHLGRLTGLKLIDLGGVKITDKGIRHLKSLVNLEQIDLDGFGVVEKGFAVGDEGVALLSKLPKLKRLTLRRSNVTNTGLIHLRGNKSLKSLSLGGTKVSDAGIPHLKEIPNLEFLSLGISGNGVQIKPSHVTDAGTKHLSEISSLRWLRIYGTNITDLTLKSTEKLSRLEYLDVSDTKVTNSGLRHLTGLPALKKIRIKSLSDQGAVHLAKIPSLVEISGFLDLTDEGVASLSKLPKLEYLNLTNNNISDLGMLHIAKMKSLKRLWFQGCPITDFGLEQLTGLNSLEMLMLNDTDITDEGLQLLEKLPSLKNLVVRFKSDALSADRKKSALRHLEKLEHLESFEVSGTALRNDDLIAIGDYLRGIKKLEISDMIVDNSGVHYLSELTSLESLRLQKTTITDEGMQDLSYMPHLEYLTISAPITDKGLKQLKNMKFLRRFQIASPHITDQDIEDLKKSLPALQNVNRYKYRPAQ